MTNRAPNPEPPAEPEATALEDAAPVRLVGPLELQTHTTLDLIAHVLSPEGIAIDVVLRNAKHGSLEEDAMRAALFTKALAAKGLKAIPAPEAPVINVAAPAAPAAAAKPEQLEYTGKVPEECPDCGGEIFDNRAKKKSGEMAAGAPFFACKDKDGCGWKKWPPRAAGARGNANNRRPANNR